MDDIIIENIVASANITDEFDIEYLASKIDDFKYNPEEFKGLVLQFDDPKIAALIIPNGKVVFTGAKKIYDIESILDRIILKLKNAGIAVEVTPEIQVENIVASLDLNIELDLASLAVSTYFDNIEYEPEKFPGLIYKINEIEAEILFFSSGKIVVTGAKKIEDIDNAMEKIKDKFITIGIL